MHTGLLDAGLFRCALASGRSDFGEIGLTAQLETSPHLLEGYILVRPHFLEVAHLVPWVGCPGFFTISPLQRRSFPCWLPGLCYCLFPIIDFTFSFTLSRGEGVNSVCGSMSATAYAFLTRGSDHDQGYEGRAWSDEAFRILVSCFSITNHNQLLKQREGLSCSA